MLILDSLYKVVNWIKKFNTTLWTGTFSSGSITVPDTSKYLAFRITLQGYDCIGFIDDDGSMTINHAVNLSGSDTQYFDSAKLTISGNTWTIVKTTEIAHYASGNHGSSAAISITNIIGLIPIGGDSKCNFPCKGVFLC